MLGEAKIALIPNADEPLRPPMGNRPISPRRLWAGLNYQLEQS